MPRCSHLHPPPGAPQRAGERVKAAADLSIACHASDGTLATAVLPPQPAMAAGGAATSAAHVLALLEEEDDSLKLWALQQLDRSVHDFWFQVASSIASIEALYEDEEFSHRELAALVASKVRCQAPGAPAR